MKIGVFGDSFADERNVSAQGPNESWCHCIKQQFELDCWARSGTSTWYSFDLFMKHYHDYSYIVFCYSDPHRIHHLPTTLTGLNYVKPGVMHSEHVDNLATVYYKNFWNEHLDSYLAQCMFDTVNSVCAKNDIKLVNLMPFENGENTTVNRQQQAGMTITGLRRLSILEASMATRQTLDKKDSRWCHLTRENNQVLADMIVKGFDTKDACIDVNTVQSIQLRRTHSDRYS